MKFTMPRQETVQKIFKEYALIPASTLLWESIFLSFQITLPLEA